jgi:hypothetical protein
MSEMAWKSWLTRVRYRPDLLMRCAILKTKGANDTRCVNSFGDHEVPVLDNVQLISRHSQMSRVEPTTMYFP